MKQEELSMMYKVKTMNYECGIGAYGIKYEVQSWMCEFRNMNY